MYAARGGRSRRVRSIDGPGLWQSGRCGTLARSRGNEPNRPGNKKTFADASANSLSRRSRLAESKRFPSWPPLVKGAARNPPKRGPTLGQLSEARDRPIEIGGRSRHNSVSFGSCGRSSGICVEWEVGVGALRQGEGHAPGLVGSGARGPASLPGPLPGGAPPARLSGGGLPGPPLPGLRGRGLRPAPEPAPRAPGAGGPRPDPAGGTRPADSAWDDAPIPLSDPLPAPPGRRARRGGRVGR